MSTTGSGMDSTNEALTKGGVLKAGTAAASAAEGAATSAAAFATRARAAATALRGMNSTATAIRVAIGQLTGDASEARQAAVRQEVDDAITVTSDCADEAEAEATKSEAAATLARGAATAARDAVGKDAAQAAKSADTATEKAAAAKAAAGEAEKHKATAENAVKRLAALAMVARQSWNPFDPYSVVIAGIDTIPAQGSPPPISAEFRKEPWEA